MTEEQKAKLREGRKRAAEMRRRQRAAAAQAEVEPAVELPPTLAELGLGTEPEESLDDILSNEEIEAIRKRAREEVAAERRKSRARAFLDLAKDEARREYDMVPADEAREKEMQEPVWIRINLPRLRLANGREAAPDPILLDQRAFVHGWSGYVPRHQHEYLMDLMNRAWQHVAQVDGRSRTYYSEQLGTMVYQGGVAQGGAIGPSFDSIHRRPA